MIEVRQIRKTYGQTEALKGVSFTVPERCCYGLIGPNGAGKTTTLRILATLAKPDRGQATVGGLDVVENPREVRRIVGYMPDDFRFHGEMSVSDYLDHFAAMLGLRGEHRRKVAGEVLDLVDLGGRRDAVVRGLSRGMKQRLSLAKTLLHDPRYLLLDEPASGLDPRARIEIRALLMELRSMGKTIVISSHILADLQEICDRVAIVEAGRFVAEGAVAEIVRSHVREGFRVRVRPRDGATPEARAALEGCAGVKDVTERGAVFEVTLDGATPEDVLRALLAKGIGVSAFHDGQDLEEAFLRSTQGEVA